MDKFGHGGDIYSNSCSIDFSASVNPLKLPDRVREAACRAVGQCGAYPDPQCRELRRALSRKEGVPAEWIVCGNGASELIYAASGAVRPHRALLCDPCFSEYEAALSLCGCEIERYSCRKDSGYAPDEAFAGRITENTDMVFLCNPGNPAGTAVPPGILRLVAQRCAEMNCVLVSDECFVPLMDEKAEEKVSLKGKLGQDLKLFIIRSLTKVYPLAGMRIGYGICSDPVLRHAVRKQMQPWNVSLPAQAAGIAALEEPGFEEKTDKLIRAEKRYLLEKLRELGLACLKPDANFIFFSGPEGLYTQCAARGILIRDCSNYRGLGPGCYRVAVRTHAEDEELIRVLGGILDAGALK